jgi:hypothetical protein
MNILPVFTLLYAQSQKDTPPDAARAALIAAAIRPSWVGFMMGILLASQAAKPRALAALPAAAGGTGSGPSGFGGGPSTYGGPSPTPSGGGPAATVADIEVIVIRAVTALQERLDEIDERLEKVEEKVNARLGAELLAEVVPLTAQPFVSFPSFLSRTKAQARAYAESLGLNEPTFVIEGDESPEALVMRQRPAPGAPWSQDMRDVILQLG